MFYKNKDDHGKNFSFIYREEENGYRLSPAYDLTSLPYKFEHEITVNGNDNPTEKDLMEVAKMFGLKKDYCLNVISEENVNIK